MWRNLRDIFFTQQFLCFSSDLTTNIDIWTDFLCLIRSFSATGLSLSVYLYIDIYLLLNSYVASSDMVLPPYRFIQIQLRYLCRQIIHIIHIAYLPCKHNFPTTEDKTSITPKLIVTKRIIPKARQV